MPGTKPKTSTAPDMRKTENKAKYGTVENRDKTAPRGKLKDGQAPTSPDTSTPTMAHPELQPLVQQPATPTSTPTKGK